MTHGQEKSPPGRAAGIKGAKPNASNLKGQGKTIAAPAVGPLRECPSVTPELFPGRAYAIRAARTPLELHKAVARYSFAAMWARHSVGRGFDLAREVVANSIASHARRSSVRPHLHRRFIAHVVARMDEAARRAVEGADA